MGVRLTSCVAVLLTFSDTVLPVEDDEGLCVTWTDDELEIDGLSDSVGELV